MRSDGLKLKAPSSTTLPNAGSDAVVVTVAPPEAPPEAGELLLEADGIEFDARMIAIRIITKTTIEIAAFPRVIECEDVGKRVFFLSLRDMTVSDHSNVLDGGAFSYLSHTQYLWMTTSTQHMLTVADLRLPFSADILARWVGVVHVGSSHIGSCGIREVLLRGSFDACHGAI